MIIYTQSIPCHLTKRTFKTCTSRDRAKSSSSVSMVIWIEGASDRPRQITDPEHFAKREFDEIWEEIITPRFKLDRSLQG